MALCSLDLYRVYCSNQFMYQFIHVCVYMMQKLYSEKVIISIPSQKVTCNRTVTVSMHTVYNSMYKNELCSTPLLFYNVNHISIIKVRPNRNCTINNNICIFFRK